MKALRFCFALFGLFFLSNGVLKAQIQPPQVNVVPALTQVNSGLQRFSITVSSYFFANLAISLHNCGTCEEDGFFLVTGNGDVQECGSLTTKHTFVVELPVGEQTYLTCGYMDDTGTYKASDGGCIIGVDP